MKLLKEHNWHSKSPREVVDILEADPDEGLTETAVGERRTEFGRNILTPAAGKSPLKLFLEQFKNPMIYILLVAAVATLLLHEWVETVVIASIVLVNAVIGFAQESRALQAMAALSRAVETEATVVRAGVRKKIPAEDLVPGDIVVLQSGDKVPADLRIMTSRDLQVDESALTGESLSVRKQCSELSENTALADRTNMAYSSTLVTYGTGTGIVTAIGDHTEVGHINEMIASADILETPLTRKIHSLSNILLVVILGVSAAMMVFGLLRGFSVDSVFMGVVALAVSAIPESLPAVVTVTLALGVSKMAERHAIIRKLPAVETLGGTTVICSDKTGTLTQNEMTVREILSGGCLFEVTGVGYAAEGGFNRDGLFADPSSCPPLMDILRCGVLCNDSRLVSTEEGMRVEGDPTEGALIAAARKAGLQRDELDRALPRKDAIPFESEYMYMATLHDRGADLPPVLYVKGALENILPRCRDAYDDALQEIDLDREGVEARSADMAARGLRVLAFAGRQMPANTATIDHDEIRDLTFLGLQAMIDPPRQETAGAIHDCYRAGVAVKMITGDHKTTAAAIACQIVEDWAHDEAELRGYAFDIKAVSGRELEDLDAETLKNTARQTHVFARVAPEQKLRLVEALQADGNVVAMTGDGVNDAPALRKADIGVAMGITGTEVAKEAADMVLTDDNFSTIRDAIEEGRGVYDNIVKFITWNLPTNVAESGVILLAAIFGRTLPITPLQILWVNTVAAGLLGLMLAFEPKEPGIMERPPRDPREGILPPVLMGRVLGIGLLLIMAVFLVYERAMILHLDIGKARTAAVNAIVFGEIFYLFGCRSLRYSTHRIGFFTNRRLLAGVMAIVVLQLLFTYAGFMNVIFETAPIGIRPWLYILVSAWVVFLAVEAEKWFRRRREAGGSSISSPRTVEQIKERSMA